MTAPCPLCERVCPREMMQRHHLQTRKHDRFDIQLICSDCHKMIHALFDNREIARELATIASLKANPEIARALTFIRKQAPGSRTRVKPARRRRR